MTWATPPKMRAKGRKHDLVDMSQEDRPVIHPRGTRVLARVGTSADWKPGTIREMHRSGATVKFDGGREGFCYIRNIRLEPKNKSERWKNPESLVATISQIARLDDRRVTAEPMKEETPISVPPPPVSFESSTNSAASIDALAPTRIVSNTITQRFVTPIGVVFQTHRRRLGWSQSTMAMKIRVSSAQVSDIEMGEKLPDDDVLIAFAEATGAEIGDLIDRRQQSASGQAIVKQKEVLPAAKHVPVPVPAPAVVADKETAPVSPPPPPPPPPPKETNGRPLGPVEFALAEAMKAAASAGKWDVVEQLAKELNARSVAPPSRPEVKDLPRFSVPRNAKQEPFLELRPPVQMAVLASMHQDFGDQLRRQGVQRALSAAWQMSYQAFRKKTGLDIQHVAYKESDSSGVKVTPVDIILRMGMLEGFWLTVCEFWGIDQGGPNV